MTAEHQVGPAIRRLDFQEQAATQVGARYLRHVEETAAERHATGGRPLPFFQGFAAITLMGKTLVLGDAVNRVDEAMPLRPIVLWLSRGRVLAQSTYNTFQPGNRYATLLADGVPVSLLADFSPADAADGTETVVYFGTIGTFSAGDASPHTGFSVSGSDVDALTPETRERLRARTLADGRRRPLILVYDEAHDLSDEHARLLMSMEPDVILLAASTMKIPAAIDEVAARLKAAGWRDEELTTIPRFVPEPEGL